MTRLWPGGERIAVWGGDEPPAGLVAEGQCHRIVEVCNHWRIHTRWWEAEAVWREYWKMTTDTGLLCLLYHDLRTGNWFLARLYD